MQRQRTGEAVRVWRLAVLVVLLALRGCRGPVPGERFDSLALALSERQVEGLLGAPAFRYEHMWEYRLAHRERGYVAFDRRGRVTAWVREDLPRLRSGLVPITETTYKGLRFAATEGGLLRLLGDPARRDDGRWQYRTAEGYTLTLQVSPEDGLVGKSWVKEDSAHVEGGLLPLSEEACGRLRVGATEEGLLLVLGEPTRREGGRWHYVTAAGDELVVEIGPDGKLVAKSWRPASEQGPGGVEPSPPTEVELEVPSP